jgi:predicted MFS family arabinose efflux permease
MTGLKLLADRVEGKLLSRAVTWHAASMGIASALSFVLAGTVAAFWDWRAAFMVAGGGAGGAWLMAALFAPKQTRPEASAIGPSGMALFDFRPVFANCSAMAYSVGYCIHTWEMGACAVGPWPFLPMSPCEIMGRTTEVNSC